MIRIEKRNPRIASPERAVLLTLAILLSSQLVLSPAGGNGAKRDYKAMTSIAGHRILRIFDRTNSALKTPVFFPGKLFQDRSGRYWVAGVSTSKTVFVYDDSGQYWTAFLEERGTDSGFLHLRFGALLPSDVQWIRQSRDGKIWFSDKMTNSDRMALLTSFNETQWQRFDFFEYAGSLSIGIACDAEGLLWFWSGEELRSYDGKRWSSVTKVSDMFKEPLTSGERAGDPKNIRYEIYDAIQDRDKFWWFAMQSGIVRYDKKRNEWRRFPQIEPHYQIYEDKSGRLWFSNGELVSVYDKRKDTVRNFWLPDHLPGDRCGYSLPVLRCMYQDKRGQMLFGHACGLLSYSEASSKWELITFADLGVSEHDEESNEVNDIMEDKNGRIWISLTDAIVVLEP